MCVCGAGEGCDGIVWDGVVLICGLLCLYLLNLRDFLQITFKGYRYGYDSCDTLYDYHIQDFMIMHLPLCARSTMMGVFITDISTVSV